MIRGLTPVICELVGHIWRLKLHAEGRDCYVCARCRAMRIREVPTRA